MDSRVGDQHRQLPDLSGASVSRWMRRPDYSRGDFMDMCASPPADGFFYAKPNKVNDPPKVNEQPQTVPESCYGSVRRPVGVVRSVKSASTLLHLEDRELEEGSGALCREASKDDSAPTSLDHILARSTSLATQVSTAGCGGGLGLVEKYERLTTPEELSVSASVTPVATPSPSPKMVRRPGNPFFSGTAESASGSEGSWLFRSQKCEDVLYEPRREVRKGENATGAKVRYVPRPSKLRELNFFSPTSM